MIDTMDPEFSTGLRKALVTTVSRPSPGRRRGSVRAWLIGGLTVTLVASAGVAAGVLLTTPGGEKVTPLGPRVTASATGSGTLALGATPSDATTVEFEFECLTQGSFLFGLNGASVSCSADDTGGKTALVTGQLPLSSLVDQSVSVITGDSSEWTMTARYVAIEPVPLATNANGNTYGTEVFEANPDLILAQATNGKTGYVRRSELDGAGGPEPTSPAQAVEVNKYREGKTFVIPVYESDGTTVIGQFEVGG